MVDAQDGLNVLKWGINGLKTLGAIGTFADEAAKLANQSPELKADLIVKGLNDKDKLGVKFEREGTVAVGKMNKTQINNLINVEAQLTDDERAKLFGGKINMSLDLIKDRTSRDGDIIGGTLKMDANTIQNWSQFIQAMDYFTGKDGAAPALKAAITTGDVTQVRKVIGTAAPAEHEAPAASAPEVTPAKKKPWDKILDKLPSLPKGTGTPAPTSGEGGPQSKVDQPIDVAALTAQLGLKAPAAGVQSDSPTATYGGTAPVRSTDRNVG